MKQALLILFLLATTYSYAQLRGKVISVHDGDSITVADSIGKKYKIRLYAVDCPELDQPFGLMAKQFTGNAVHGKQVLIINKGRDRYKRLVGIVVIGTDTLNKELLRNGYAWHYCEYDKGNIYWHDLQQTASTKKAGLWRSDATDPKIWRRY